MRITDTSSIREGEQLLKEKELVEECRKIAENWCTDKDNNRKRIEDMGWDCEHTFSVGCNRPRFDAFKNGVGLEHEKGEQMNVRSHLLFMEVAFRKRIIDVGVFILPDRGYDANVRRTKRELKDEIFTKYFPLTVPVYLLGYKE